MSAVTPSAQLTPVELPARTIEPPTTISAEARAALPFAAALPSPRTRRPGICP